MTRRLALAASVAAVALCSIGTAARAAVLYDQTDHPGANNADSSAPNFAPSNDFGGGNFDRTADDFTVPAGHTWSLDGIDVSGAYSGSPPGIVNVYVYPDVSGKPGSELFSQTGIAAPGGPNYVVPLAGFPNLGAGTYWVTVQQDAVGGYWSWTTRSVQSGGPARWFGEAMSCPSFSWSPRTDCWAGTNPDQIFRLRGSDTILNNISVGKPKLNKKRGTAVLPVTVPGPGDLSVSGPGVGAHVATGARAATAVTGPGIVKVKVKAKGKLKRRLNTTGKAKLKVTVTFTPTGGSASSQHAKLKLKKR
jgi:hypothetical protein